MNGARRMTTAEAASEAWRALGKMRGTVAVAASDMAMTTRIASARVIMMMTTSMPNMMSTTTTIAAREPLRETTSIIMIIMIMRMTITR
jgi:hypothetical protein